MVHCILLTTKAGAGDNWRGREVDCVPLGRAAEAGGDQAPQVGGQESVRTRRGRFQLTISAGVGSSLDTAPGGELWSGCDTSTGRCDWWPVQGRASRGLAASALELETKVIRRFPRFHNHGEGPS